MAERHVKALQEKQEEHQTLVDNVEVMHATALEEKEEEKTREMNQLKSAHDQELAKLKEEHEALLLNAKEEVPVEAVDAHAAELAKLKEEHEALLLNAKEEIPTDTEEEMKELKHRIEKWVPHCFNSTNLSIFFGPFLAHSSKYRSMNLTIFLTIFFTNTLDVSGYRWNWKTCARHTPRTSRP